MDANNGILTTSKASTKRDSVHTVFPTKMFLFPPCICSPRFSIEKKKKRKQKKEKDGRKYVHIGSK